MSIEKIDLVSFILIISSSYWMICHAYSINAVNDTIQLNINEEWKNHQKVHSMRFTRETERALNLSAENSSNITTYNCNCNRGHVATTTSRSPIINALESIIKVVLMEMDSIMGSIRENFEGAAALIHSMVDVPAGALPWDKLFEEYSYVQKTVGQLMELFNKVFNNVPIINITSYPIEFMSGLKNKTIQWLHSPLSKVRFPSMKNPKILISSIQEKVKSKLHKFLDNGRESNNNISAIMNWMQKIFNQIGKGSTPSWHARNHMVNVGSEFKSILAEILKGESNLSYLMTKLRNETLKMLIGFNAEFPRNQFLQNSIENIFELIGTTLSGSFPLTIQREIGFNWWNIFNSLTTWVEYMKNIPLHIVQLFKSITASLMPSKMLENQWQKMKTLPLLVGQCYSSEIDKLWGISRPGLPYVSHLASNFWKHKPRYSSLWEKLKSKLNQGCSCH